MTDRAALTRLVERFLASKANEGASPKTIEAYRIRLNGFTRWVDADDWAAVTRDDVEDYLYVERARLSPASRRADVVALRSFFGYLVAVGRLPASPCAAVKFPRIPKRRPTFYRPEEVARILSIPCAPRDRVLVRVLARQGQRIDNVVRLRWECVDFKRAVVRYPAHKGGDPITMPLDLDTARMLRALRALKPEAEYVFEARRGKPMHYDTANRVLRDICRQAGVQWRGCHEFRRTLATTLLQMGEPLHRVSRNVLGHADVTTTVNHYAGAEDDDIGAAIRRLPY